MVRDCSGVKDARTGLPLDEELVRAGRLLELGSMKYYKVWEFVRVQESRGKKMVRVKWVQGLRGDGSVRARLVAMEFATDLRGDTFAGTPGLVVVRYIISRCATRGLGKKQCTTSAARSSTPRWTRRST